MNHNTENEFNYVNSSSNDKNPSKLEEILSQIDDIEEQANYPTDYKQDVYEDILSVMQLPQFEDDREELLTSLKEEHEIWESFNKIRLEQKRNKNLSNILITFSLNKDIQLDDVFKYHVLRFTIDEFLNSETFKEFITALTANPYNSIAMYLKFECSVFIDDDSFNPHFHLLIVGLKQFNQLTDDKMNEFKHRLKKWYADWITTQYDFIEYDSNWLYEYGLNIKTDFNYISYIFDIKKYFRHEEYINDPHKTKKTYGAFNLALFAKTEKWNEYKEYMNNREIYNDHYIRAVDRKYILFGIEITGMYKIIHNRLIRSIREMNDRAKYEYELEQEQKKQGLIPYTKEEWEEKKWQQIEKTLTGKMINRYRIGTTSNGKYPNWKYGKFKKWFLSPQCIDSIFSIKEELKIQDPDVFKRGNSKKIPPVLKSILKEYDKYIEHLRGYREYRDYHINKLKSPLKAKISAKKWFNVMDTADVFLKWDN